MVAAARSALAGLFGLSPSARQRSEIKRDVQLHQTLKDQQLDDASAKVEGLINYEVERYCARKTKSLGRSYAWSTLFAGSTLAVVPGVGAWLLYPPHGAWQTTSFVAIVSAGGIWMVGTIGAFFTARSKSAEQEQAP